MPRNTFNSRATATFYGQGSSFNASSSHPGSTSSKPVVVSEDSQTETGDDEDEVAITGTRQLGSPTKQQKSSHYKDSSSELSSDEDDAALQPSSSTRKGKKKATEKSPRKRRSKFHASTASDSSDEEGSDDDDEDEAIRLAINEAGDGDSLLGSESQNELSQDDADSDSQEELHAHAYANAQRAAGLLGKEDNSDSDSDGILAEEEARIIADEEARQQRKKRRSADKRRFCRHLYTGDDTDSGGDGDGDASSRHFSQVEDAERNTDSLRGQPTSVSPSTLRALGLSSLGYGDVLFEQQTDFHTDSEPSFTDFFNGEASSSSGSDSESGAGTDSEGTDSDNESDLDALTTDDDTDSNLSALEAAILAGEPLVFGRANLDGSANPDSSLTGLVEGLLAGADANTAHAIHGGVGNRDTPDDDDQFNSAENVAARALAAEEARRCAEMPLLVIEDLDGRLIYARAGNGEAVFGSDGEFEYIGGEEETESDEDDPYEYWSDIDEGLLAALGPGADAVMSGGGNHGADPSAKALGKRRARDVEETEDDGETTDELPEDDLQFSRLLVGSIEPHGGRQSRRRRALALKSRKLSPANFNTTSKGTHASAATAAKLASSSHSRADSGTLSISDVASDSAPITLPEEMQVSANDAKDSVASASNGQKALQDALQQAAHATAVAAATEGQRDAAGSSSGLAKEVVTACIAPATPVAKPLMGSFVPSSNAKHRAVIDGQRPVPSPFSLHNRVRNKGLGLQGKRKRGRDAGLDPSQKRQRRFSIDDIIGRPLVEAESAQGYMSTPEDNGEDIQLVDLDDVVDASMLWRPGPGAASPDIESNEDADKKGRKRQLGFNVNAFARWNKVPMQSFRDGQQQQQQQPQESASSMQFGNSRFARELRKGLDRGPRQRTDSSPFRGRAAERARLGTDRAGMDAMLTPTSLTGPANGILAISPVLFPQSDAQPQFEGNSHGLSSGSLQATALAEVPPFDLQSDGCRKITRREKREKKARKTALRIALQAGEAPTSAFERSNSPSLQQHRSASVPASPGVFTGTMPQFAVSAPSPLSLSAISPGATGREVPRSPLANRSRSPSADKGKQTLNLSLPGLEANDNGSNDQSDKGNPTGLDPSAVSARAPPTSLPPSSAIRAPLYSPLFGGIAPPAGLIDDLDEQPVETLMI